MAASNLNSIALFPISMNNDVRDTIKKNYNIFHTYNVIHKLFDIHRNFGLIKAMLLRMRSVNLIL